MDLKKKSIKSSLMYFELGSFWFGSKKGYIGIIGRVPDFSTDMNEDGSIDQETTPRDGGDKVTGVGACWLQKSLQKHILIPPVDGEVARIDQTAVSALVV